MTDSAATDASLSGGRRMRCEMGFSFHPNNEQWEFRAFPREHPRAEIQQRHR